MKRASLFATLLLILVQGTAFAAEPLTETDREKLLAHLDISANAFLDSVKGLTDEQWNYRSGEGRWTIAEVAEHLAAAESLIRGGAEGAMKQPATPEMLVDARKDDGILARVTNRDEKFKAPEPLVPTNRYRSPQAAVEAFETERATTMKLARNGGDLRAYAAKGPAGNLDAYGWLLFTSAHTVRHTKQIDEVKATPGFPK